MTTTTTTLSEGKLCIMHRVRLANPLSENTYIAAYRARAFQSVYIDEKSAVNIYSRYTARMLLCNMFIQMAY